MTQQGIKKGAIYCVKNFFKIYFQTLKIFLCFIIFKIICDLMNNSNGMINVAVRKKGMLGVDVGIKNWF